MTVDTSTLVVQLVLLAAIILAPWFHSKSRRRVRVRFVPLSSKSMSERAVVAAVSAAVVAAVR